MINGWFMTYKSVRHGIVHSSEISSSCQCPFLMSVSQITPSLYLGGVDVVLKPTALSRRNITLIINATAEHSCPQYKGVECLHVPVLDQPHASLACHFDTVAERIHNNQLGSTLVHCTAGRSRSPTLVIAYLMKYEGVSLRQAHEWVLKCRPHIRPNAGFWRQLMEYERKLYGKNTVRMTATSCGVLPEALDGQEGLYCVNG
ncbi:dual specificity protein phosphatase 18-like isoform X2 [Esox lucius]|uniref:Protein-tyrosine-phosphatase n=3 Tax=Esox lucius TaxID=8010 RepID=A0AAY5JVQ8_ESOLU|nr:dual specificity protein phosphatase 18-like isoform X2 [Esox lucius]